MGRVSWTAKLFPHPVALSCLGTCPDKSGLPCPYVMLCSEKIRTSIFYWSQTAEAGAAPLVGYMIWNHSMQWRKTHKQDRRNLDKAERLSRLIVSIMTCLGALGLAALLFFPLYFNR